jgi:uncharacterized protein
MNCPRCSVEMSEAVRYGVSIDTCPLCGGIWLEKGELGTIIKRTEAAGSSIDEELGLRGREKRGYNDRGHGKDHHEYENDHHDKHKKKSFFDFFD